MDFTVAKISSKGQVVIPKNIRKGFNKGDKLLIARDGDVIIMRHARAVEEQMAEDLAFARRTEAVLRKYEKDPGSFKKMPADQFLKELEKW